jgi:thiamine pyrophosphate-dependent acetolactate synthase large subunit-like protein
VRSFGAHYWQVSDDPSFERALGEALACGLPALVEVTL